MPVTLEQAKLNTQDAIQAGVIDEFRKSSYLLDNLTFDDAVAPGTNGATLTYHHIISRALGGADEYKNLQLVHISCHIDHHTKHPANGKIATQQELRKEKNEREEQTFRQKILEELQRRKAKTIG